VFQYTLASVPQLMCCIICSRLLALSLNQQEAPAANRAFTSESE